MNEQKSFQFQLNQSVRVEMKDGEPLFCLKDVAEILEMDSRAASKFNLAQKGVAKLSTPTEKGKQVMTFINEPNLYRVIFRSNKPEAVKFQDWIFEEVIPQIRKTGAYSGSLKTTKDDRTGLRQAVTALVGRFDISHSEAYKLVHHRFNVGHIDELSHEQIVQAVEYVHRLILDGELLDKEPEQPQIPNYDYGMARLFVKHGAGVAQVSDLHMALYQLSHIQGTFLKMLEHKALHFKLNDDEKRCLDTLAHWQMAIANVGCKL